MEDRMTVQVELAERDVDMLLSALQQFEESYTPDEWEELTALRADLNRTFSVIEAANRVLSVRKAEAALRRRVPRLG